MTAPGNKISEEDLEKCRAEAKATVKKAVEFADASPPPPAGLAKVGREGGREGGKEGRKRRGRKEGRGEAGFYFSYRIPHIF